MPAGIGIATRAPGSPNRVAPPRCGDQDDRARDLHRLAHHHGGEHVGLDLHADQHEDEHDQPRQRRVDERQYRHRDATLVTVMDGHPHTLAFLAGARGDLIRNLGVTQFGQSSSVEDAYLIHGIDRASIVRAAVDLV